jgi:hypothetical protein
VRAGEARVDVGAGGHQRLDLRACLGDMPRPVGDDVQQGAGLHALGVTDAHAGHGGVLVDEQPELCGVARADHLGDLARQRGVRRQRRRRLRALRISSQSDATLDSATAAPI